MFQNEDITAWYKESKVRLEELEVAKSYRRDKEDKAQERSVDWLLGVGHHELLKE